MIGVKANRIRSVPPQALPPLLRWLTLTDNAIEALPEAIGECGQLQKLMLAGNQLTTLPASLAACSRLELLRIAANRLMAPPDWLLSMPGLAGLCRQPHGPGPTRAAASSASHPHTRRACTTPGWVVRPGCGKRDRSAA